MTNLLKYKINNILIDNEKSFIELLRYKYSQLVDNSDSKLLIIMLPISGMECLILFITKLTQCVINPCTAELFVSIFRHFKLELLTQFSASNDEKYVYS